MKKSEIMQIIREEVEVILTNEEAQEIFNLDPSELLDEMMDEVKGDGKAWGSPYDPKGPVHQVDPRVTSAEDDPWGPETKKKEPGVGGQPPEWERKLAKSDPRTKTKKGAAKHQRRKEKPAGKEIEDLEEEKDWIQKAVSPEHEGDCTPMTKSTCTPARKALAKRFKKAARKKKKEGGSGWQGKV